MGMEVASQKGKRGRKPGVRKEVICPKCGQPGYEKIATRGSRQYIYVYHYTPQGKKLKMCYIAPVGGYTLCRASAIPPAPSPG